MKILLWSTAPWCKTGYGRNCRYLLNALKGKAELDVLATFGLEGGVINVNGVNVYPTGGNFWVMDEWVKYWSDVLASDIILQHFDIWVIKPSFIVDHGLKLVTYSPVDGYPIPFPVKASADGALDNIAMSKFAQDSYIEQGLRASTVIYHPVDHGSFYPMDKRECRRLLGIPEDKFVIGFVGTNKGPRKNIPNQLVAFKKFLDETKVDAYLYLHTYMERDEINPEGTSIPHLLELLDLSGKVLTTDKIRYRVGLHDDVMRLLYNSFDVLSQCTLGEGFGIPIVEAQACGTPVIGTDCSAITEVVGAGGSLVKQADKIEWQRIGSWHAIPSTVDITEEFKKYSDRDFREEKSKLALENSFRFTMKKWNDQWAEYFNL